MCGIAGKLYFEMGRLVEREVVERMNAVLTHRGPDDAGIYCQGQPALARKKVEVLTKVEDGLPEIQLDAAKIRQVLLNLIQNAAEAMGEGGGHVMVRGSALAGSSGVVLVVEDDGPGISRASLEHLFEPFFTTKFAGTGLGLAISKSLIEQHGGRIEVTTEPGHGATFFVFLPGSVPPARRTPSGERA